MGKSKRGVAVDEVSTTCYQSSYRASPLLERHIAEDGMVSCSFTLRMRTLLIQLHVVVLQSSKKLLVKYKREQIMSLIGRASCCLSCCKTFLLNIDLIPFHSRRFIYRSWVMKTFTFYEDLQESESDEALESVIHHIISEWQFMGSLVCNFTASSSVVNPLNFVLVLQLIGLVA